MYFNNLLQLLIIIAAVQLEIENMGHVAVLKGGVTNHMAHALATSQFELRPF